MCIAFVYISVCRPYACKHEHTMIDDAEHESADIVQVSFLL